MLIWLAIFSLSVASSIGHLAVERIDTLSTSEPNDPQRTEVPKSTEGFRRQSQHIINYGKQSQSGLTTAKKSNLEFQEESESVPKMIKKVKRAIEENVPAKMFDCDDSPFGCSEQVNWIVRLDSSFFDKEYSAPSNNKFIKKRDTELLDEYIPGGPSDPAVKIRKRFMQLYAKTLDASDARIRHKK